jgi:hypothetical protein
MYGNYKTVQILKGHVNELTFYVDRKHEKINNAVFAQFIINIL